MSARELHPLVEAFVTLPAALADPDRPLRVELNRLLNALDEADLNAEDDLLCELGDLDDRMERAAGSLVQLLDGGDPQSHDYSRLVGKRQGVQLAQSYVREAIRSVRAGLPSQTGTTPAPTAAESSPAP